MALVFNPQGYLRDTTRLSYEEFLYHFVTNPVRKQQIDNALHFFRVFYQCGCRIVYVDGSFVSTKKYPGDIDLCFDLTNVDIEKIRKGFPAFFDPTELGRIHRNLECHLLYVTRKYKIIFDMLQTDRSGDSKGFAKLSLKQILDHDQK